jgi:hypothetical protein
MLGKPPRVEIEGSEMIKLAIALAAVLTLALGAPLSTTYAAEAGDTPADVVTPPTDIDTDDEAAAGDTPADVATPPTDIDTDDEAAAEDQEAPSGGESEAEEETQPE